ncbi:MULTISPECIES: cell division protein SepF [Rossellomorea]|jgi:cell division inhibitor SepF|uniref:Cell division protein SepF n=1 Tax=Rossellomorea aquimaris TaxID=189382 RepID=A0A366EWW6_9BACI|nr:cell division protein SepF [Rossellomorea aquimaris]RBP06893.1 cell division inhibitor SepF [Rossellomorea aquimaris]TYS80451.1 cell division protein SepF [Rossellomorea aquimaris]TYS85838.1 cell division protein SepF [Rossellomorea aquimaris]TYS91065.1 cell division protein SepF [Rossellomorea aquimaris]WRP08372.1 cell division protein SepF [Rossellomorea aquimaris]
MGIKSKFKTFFLLDEDEYDYEEEKFEEEYEEKKPMKSQLSNSKQNVVSLQSVQKSSKMILVEPRVYAEAQEIADHLKNRRSVLVNLQRIQHDQAKRIVDFLSGTVYAIGGDIQRVGDNIFLCTPDNVEVSGNISEFLKEEDLSDSRW